MKSRVHPNHKTKYRVQNWPEYERGLVRRGDITIWLLLAATAAWPVWSHRPAGRFQGSLDAVITF